MRLRLVMGQMPAQPGSCRENLRFQQHVLESKWGRSCRNADLAASSSVIASSTLDPAHGAALAVDGLDSSFWVSKLERSKPCHFNG